MRKIGVWITLATVISIAIWLVFGAIIFSQWGWQGLGTFGDTYGSLNTLFSGLAMVGVIAAIIMQKQELGHQREELVLGREQQERSVDAQKASEEALTKQVEMLRLSAQISAYSSLIQSLRASIAAGLMGQGLTAANLDIARYTERLRKLLDNIE